MSSIWISVLSWSYISENNGNVVQENVDERDWGGTCRCPDGETYEVGDNGDACWSLACVNGEMVNCNRMEGEWSGRKVTCKGIVLLGVWI